MYIERREINDFGQERSLDSQERKTKQNSIIEVVTKCLHATDRPLSLFFSMNCVLAFLFMGESVRVEFRRGFPGACELLDPGAGNLTPTLCKSSDYF